MKLDKTNRTVSGSRMACAALGLLSLLLMSTVSADDRDLLRKSTGKPYVFIVMDTSGSMNWTAQCSHLDAVEDADPFDGMCTHICPMDDATCAEVCPNLGCGEYSLASLPDLDDPAIQPIIVDDADTANFSATISKITSGAPDISNDGKVTGKEFFRAGSDTFEDTSINFPGSSTSDPSTDFAHSAGRYYNSGNNKDYYYKVTYRFDKELPHAGLYHVYTYFYERTESKSNNRFPSIDARHIVEYFDGTVTRTKYTEIDQKKKSGITARQRFVYLGTFDFRANASGKVPAALTITNLDESGARVSTDQVMADAVAFVPVPQLPPTATCTKNNVYRCQQPLCPEGDCYAPASGDDPTSKLFQAKQAMFEVLEQIDDVNFGFGSYEQDDARAMFKQWRYRLVSGAAPYLFPDGKNTIAFPQIGREDVFGTGPPWTRDGVNYSWDDSGFDCVSGGSGVTADDRIGCQSAYPADLNDLWEMARVSQMPKLGQNGLYGTPAYVRAWDGTNDKFITYRIDFESKGSEYDIGEPTITIKMDIIKCDPSETYCDGSKSKVVYQDKEFTYQRISDFVPYNNVTGRYPMDGNGFFRNQSATQATNTCNGLDPNEDFNANWGKYDPPGPATLSNSDDDTWYNTAFKREWDTTDTRGWKKPDGTANTKRSSVFDNGDFVPFDWTKDKNDVIRSMLAPNTLNVTGAKPDFRFATYFHDRVLSVDYPNNTRRALRLRDDVTFVSSNGVDLDQDVYDPVYYPDDDYVGVEVGTPKPKTIRQIRRPLMAAGSTPIAGSVADFKNWYLEWVPYARNYDLSWGCSPKYLLFLTDGDETCSGDICGSGNDITYLASDARGEDRVKTYVIGFGEPDAASTLTCMAVNGKTGVNNGPGEPILPRNKDELVETLTSIFNSIRTESFSFASASIPAVQSTAADKVYLSSFTPIQAKSVWPGRLDAYRQPLPIDSSGRPEIARGCSSTVISGCHLWDAADKLLAQAPAPTDLPNFKLGPSFKSQRRIIYGQANPTGIRKALRLLVPPPEGGYTGWRADRLDMAQVLMTASQYSDYSATIPTLTESAALGLLEDVIGKTVVKKTETIQIGPNTTTNCTGEGIVSQGASVECNYVMGDIFHANPTVIIGPSNFAFFRRDLCGLEGSKDGINNCVEVTAATTIDRGYREFTAASTWRRRMLVASTNDGQLHFFDAGVYTKADDPSRPGTQVDVFTDGTGYELFSYAPRITMPAIREQAIQSKHVYSLDGTVVVSDVFIDPVNQPAKEDEREWRTILMGGMREAGDVFSQLANVPDLDSGYYALDITQPDQYEASSRRYPIGTDLGVPTCLSLDVTTGKQKPVAGCETLSGKPTLFPLELWTFQDQILIGSKRYSLDEDNNDLNDLGATWSQPVIGQIKICAKSGTFCDEDKGLTTRWVAIFGGGLDSDAANKAHPKRGNWLYMVDVESGETIYKRQLDGSAATDPSVVDIEGDGILDLIYIGTTTGYLYKVDLRKRNGGEVPALESVDIDQTMIRPKSTGLSVKTMRITDAAWEPFKILFTGTALGSTDGAPIYYPPAIFKIPERNVYGGLLLMGDREDLWIPPTNAYVPGVYVFVDENYEDDSDIILKGDLASFGYNAAPVPKNTDYLLDDPSKHGNTKRGWYMQFDPLWRATGEPFLIAGIAVFSIFDPISVPSEEDGEKICRRQGSTRGFTLFVKNGNPLASSTVDVDNTCERPDALCCSGRCFKIDEFTTAIHTASTVTKNQRPDERDDGGTYFGDKELVVNEAQRAMLDAIRDAIIDTMPSSCQYNKRYEISFAVLRNSTGLNELARVPMMICPGDWKD